MNDPRVQHFVVLMLENRSFDHMFGFLAGREEEIERLRGAESNPVDPGVADSPRIRVQRGRPYVTDPDPVHDLAGARIQMYGASGDVWPDEEPQMQGFVHSYRRGHARLRPDPAQVMTCFEPEGVPALSTLAREFMVCDHWYSSVPGPTWPNRFFTHCGTSGGSTSNGLFTNYGMKTVFEALVEAGATAAIYWDDISQAWALDRLRTTDGRKFFRPFRSFAQECRAGTLPHYSFIEPRYFGLGHGPANDQHASHHVRHGEDLIRDVYGAVRNGPCWESTALLVLYDEHGGFYDHVPPPKATAPEPPASAKAFRFDRLGVRVPCVLISPYVRRGSTWSTPADHASVIRTLCDWVPGLPKMTTRVAAAPSLADRIELRAPRQDAPRSLPVVQTATSEELAQIRSEAARGMTDLQTSMLELAAALDPESPRLGRFNRLDAVGEPTMSATAARGYVLEAVSRFMEQ